MNLKAASLLIVVSLCAACAKSGSSGGDSAAATADKALFSVWKSTANGQTLDLSHAGFSSDNEINLTLATASGPDACTCKLTITGNDSQGAASVAYDNDPGAHPKPAGDPCWSILHNYTYVNVNSQLTLCEGTACQTFE